MQPDLRDSDPHRLADTIDLNPSPQRIWGEHEYESILQHQLSVELDVVESTGPVSGPNPTHELPGQAPTSPAITIGQALFDRSTLRQLIAIKDFAKANASHPDSALPHDVAEALYFIAIAAALVQHNETITRLANQNLLAGLRWAASRPWQDARGCGVLQKALQKFVEVAQNQR